MKFALAILPKLLDVVVLTGVVVLTVPKAGIVVFAPKLKLAVVLAVPKLDKEDAAMLGADEAVEIVVVVAVVVAVGIDDDPNAAMAVEPNGVCDLDTTVDSLLPAPNGLDCEPKLKVDTALVVFNPVPNEIVDGAEAEDAPKAILEGLLPNAAGDFDALNVKGADAVVVAVAEVLTGDAVVVVLFVPAFVAVVILFPNILELVVLAELQKVKLPCFPALKLRPVDDAPKLKLGFASSTVFVAVLGLSFED